MSVLSTRIHLLREALTADREGRAKLRQLEHELTAFSTPNERLEIEEIVARYGEEESRQIRRILDRHPGLTPPRSPARADHVRLRG